MVSFCFQSVIKRLAILLTRTADLMEDVEFLKNQTSNLLKETDIARMKLEEKTNETTTAPSAPPQPDDQQQPRSRSKAKKEL